MDEGTILHEINLQTAEESPIEKVIECAQNGTWVLICPIQFPQYFTKLRERLETVTIDKNFRIFFDL